MIHVILEVYLHFWEKLMSQQLSHLGYIRSEVAIYIQFNYIIGYDTINYAA